MENVKEHVEHLVSIKSLWFISNSWEGEGGRHGTLWGAWLSHQETTTVVNELQWFSFLYTPPLKNSQFLPRQR